MKKGYSEYMYIYFQFYEYCLLISGQLWEMLRIKSLYFFLNLVSGISLNLEMGQFKDRERDFIKVIFQNIIFVNI